MIISYTYNQIILYNHWIWLARQFFYENVELELGNVLVLQKS